MVEKLRHHPASQLAHHPPDGDPHGFDGRPDKLWGAGPARLPELPPQLLERGLSDAQLGTFVAGIYNHPVKGIVIGLMETGREDPYFKTELAGLVQGSKRGLPGWDSMSDKVPIVHCELSLAPVGALVRVGSDTKGYHGYIKPPESAALTEAMAGHSLREARVMLSNGRLPEAYWGQTKTGPTARSTEIIGPDGAPMDAKRRPAHTRLQIFRELLKQHGRVSMAELGWAIGEPANAFQAHIVQLADSGIISHEAVTRAVPVFSYEFVNPLPETAVKGLHSLPFSRPIIEAAQTFDGPFNNRDLQTKLKEMFGIDAPLQSIINTTGKLRRNGNLAIVGTGSEDLSSVWLEEDQRADLERVMASVIGFQQTGAELQAFVDEGRAALKDILNRPEQVADILGRFAELSLKVNRKIDGRAEMKKVLVELPPDVTATAVYDALNTKFGYKVLSRGTVGEYLRTMREDEEVVINEAKHPHAYSLTPKGRLAVAEIVAEEPDLMDAEVTEDLPAPTRDQLQEEEVFLTKVLQPYATRLGGLVGQYKAAAGTDPERAAAVTAEIREVRSDPVYTTLLERRDRISTRIEELDAARAGEVTVFSGPSQGDLLGAADPFEQDADVPLSQRAADRRAAEVFQRRRRQGK